MGTLFSALDIARSGLQVAQIQIDTAGHNIANVNKVGFTRQRVQLTSRIPNNRPYGQLGRGVGVLTIERLRDDFLDKVFRSQSSGLGLTEVQSTYFNRMEDLFLEPGPDGFSQRLNAFFDTLNDFAGNVESIPTRQSVITEAQSLVQNLVNVSGKIFDLRTDANEEVLAFIPEINSISDRIAALNISIRDAELSGQPANDLRDDRDVLLDDLSAITNIEYRERSDGQIDVLISGDVLVDAGFSHHIEAVRNPSLDAERDDLAEIFFVENGEMVDIRDGQLRAVLNMRNDILVDLDARIDAMAAAIIGGINSIQNQGGGLSRLTGTTQGSTVVVDTSLALQAAGLPFDVAAGSFELLITDENLGTTTTTTVFVDPTLSSDAHANLINLASNVTAAYVNGQLEITPDAGFSVTFRNDSSNFLTAMGVNGVFTGHDARTIRVNQALVDDPRLLASGFSTDFLNTGDNSAAIAMAEVRDALLLDNNSQSILDHYESTVTEVGVNARSNDQALQTERAFVEEFQRRRLEVSGVSIDEEVTFLIQYQRAFEASARVISVADRMLETLISVVG